VNIEEIHAVLLFKEAKWNSSLSMLKLHISIGNVTFAVAKNGEYKRMMEIIIVVMR
jgi:hypothetical protein